MGNVNPENKLSTEKSPYLLQHADNPVNWYPWGEEAFEQAKLQDKPVFLSVGYATCHWCHVMAHESFEDDTVAAMMNEAFINIKVDREERPDIDNTYMTVCQMLTGSGGWPLTIIMTPEKKPFYAATYLPKSGRYGRPGMQELIPWIKGIWEDERQKIYDSAQEITSAFQKSTTLKPGKHLSENIFQRAFEQFRQTYDSENGGFGSAPKFPSAHNLMFLLRYWKLSGEEGALDMVTTTLAKMRRGGLFDQVGLGFHRYSTDSEWLLPHFEKMLYDQAMLAMAYTEAWQCTHKPLFKKTAEEILDYVFRDLQDAKGAFYSAEDADSEGEEGKFYVWSIEEVRKLLPANQAELAIEIFNMSEEGNYRDESSRQPVGKNILHFTKPLEVLAKERGMKPQKLQDLLTEIRSTLFKARENRPRPLLDDKILTDWNGLMIGALAKAGKAFQKDSLLREAERALSFINEELRQHDGLLHRFRDGEAAIPAHTDDYAYLIFGLTELYEATLKTEYLKQAVELNEIFLNNFWDDENGGFWFTSSDSEKLLGRKKEMYDGALPSGNSIAALNLVRLSRMTGRTTWEEHTDAIFKVSAKQVEKAPTGFSQLLQAFQFATKISHEIVFAGKREDESLNQMLEQLNRDFNPNTVVLLNRPGDSTIKELAPFIKEQKMIDGKTTVYVCRNRQCEMPVQTAEAIKQLMDS